MNHIELLANALEYMENHLEEEISTEDVAQNCFCSKSTLEKLFRCINHITVHDYLVRRRMMKAARLIHCEPDKNLLDIALQYGYSSNESFTRAFKQIWNCKPSEFRKQIRYSELFPRLHSPLEIGDSYMKNRKHVDISELYDLFSERNDCYFVCCDIRNMAAINDISQKAGDLAILEEMKRMNSVAGPNDIVFRIGGDEFTLLTNSSDISYAESIIEKIRTFNGQSFSYNNEDIPLTLHTGIIKLENQFIRYNELFTQLHTAIEECKGLPQSQK